MEILKSCICSSKYHVIGMQYRILSNRVLGQKSEDFHIYASGIATRGKIYASQYLRGIFFSDFFLKALSSLLINLLAYISLFSCLINFLVSSLISWIPQCLAMSHFNVVLLLGTTSSSSGVVLLRNPNLAWQISNSLTEKISSFVEQLMLGCNKNSSVLHLGICKIPVCFR